MEDKSSVAEQELTVQSKVISLFQFIQELNKLKQKAILNVQDYPWFLVLSALPNDPENICLHYPDRVADDTDAMTEDANVLLSVHKPEFSKCPEPALSFTLWLNPGWDDFRQEPGVIEILPGKKLDTDTQEPIPVYFADDPQRVRDYQQWLQERTVWAERQKLTAQTQKLFGDLYRLFFELKRESETEEIIAANGFLRDRSNPEISHPVLTHRVNIEFDPDLNTVSILDSQTPSGLYSVIFQMMEGINLGEISVLGEDLKKEDYHPLDRNDTPGFLKVLVHRLCSDSAFSDAGIPTNWERNSRLLLYTQPCFILRKRLDGTLKAIEQTIENVQETGDVPKPIRDIVSGGIQEIPEDRGEESIEEQLASVGGESVDILLSKQANKEQLDIARRIEQYNAVLVQGPPGTGKTHTIANLMGHFLAQGKSILVTSYTTKALRVLKDKINPGLQNLCVSMLDDSNVDMERSVNGITDYMSRTTSSEIKREMALIEGERKRIIAQLADTRRKIFTLIQKECYCIVYNGEEISPSAAAQFVLEHEQDLSYIPGKVRIYAMLPLTFEELRLLYRSNEGLTKEDEGELSCDIPSPKEILNPSEFAQTVNGIAASRKRLQEIAEKNDWRIDLQDDSTFEIAGSFGKIDLSEPPINEVHELKDHIASLGQIENWMYQAAVDGKNGGAYRERWNTLVSQIEKTCKYHESVITEQFGLDLEIINPDTISAHKPVLEIVKSILEEKGKISKLTLIMHKEYATALESAKISGHFLQTASDCKIVLHQIELTEQRGKCARYWDTLMRGAGVPAFLELDCDHQEHVAENWIPIIHRFLDWFREDYELLLDKMNMIGLPSDTLFAVSPMDSDLAAAQKQIGVIGTILPQLCDVCEIVVQQGTYQGKLENTKAVLLSGKRGSSKLCKSLLHAIDDGNREQYAGSYAVLDTAYEKYSLQHSREEMLKTLEPIAPDWADAIGNRIGIHGSGTLPDTIEDAWKWKQYYGMIEEITAMPFRDLQAKSLALSTRYREVTAVYAEKCAWYHLLRRTESNIDMNQALQGWKQTVKRIGKGTGKMAPKLKADARKLMVMCQTAVPAWIMPINKALESLSPKNNKFDIIIIDEASQSDISSLAILYMGRKLIIVGDDKQVSPMAVGVDIAKMDTLEQMYLRDKIPNSQLYNAKTSIYDIAATTFKPLMLHEHFRCVPEIIGFSNMLSYDHLIKPLREASSSNLLPAVVNYRVTGGRRDTVKKVNPQEAKMIVALMKACMEQPEYDGKSFGVISLLGDDQYQLIQREIDQQIPPKEIIQRNILCGNSANFQGDERDVIFLSLVDSQSVDKSGPLHMMNYGVDDSTRKRYNVAASRARDQLWVVHSLDAANDLKPGDIRKTLLDYAADPNAVEGTHKKIAAASESPFEEAVATTLFDRGYHLVQQWEVGAYRLDMVAVCAGKTVAIECDGERWHSGDVKVREDMERQTILERLGWRFIRIRGSEYYRNPTATIDRVIGELTDYGIEPEKNNAVSTEGRNSPLLDKVKIRAGILLNSELGIPPEHEEATIAAALRASDPVAPTPRGKDTFQILNASSTTSWPAKKTGVGPDDASITKSAEPSPKEAFAQKPTSPSQAKTKLLGSDLSLKSPVIVPTAFSTERSTPVLPERKEEIVKAEAFSATPVVERKKKVQSGAADILSLLKENKVPYLDKRPMGGALWMVGGHELDGIVFKARTLGVHFKFMPEGGKATKGKPGWWTK